MYTVQKERRIIIFLLFYFWHQTLYGTVLHHDNARPHENHTTQFLANNNVQNSPLACPVPGSVKPRVVQVCWRQSECLCKCAWVVLRIPAEVDDHPIAMIHNPIQSIPKRYLVVTHLLLICMSLGHEIRTDWTVFWTRRVLKSWVLTWFSYRMKLDALDFFVEFLNVN